MSAGTFHSHTGEGFPFLDLSQTSTLAWPLGWPPTLGHRDDLPSLTSSPHGTWDSRPAKLGHQPFRVPSQCTHELLIHHLPWRNPVTLQAQVTLNGQIIQATRSIFTGKPPLPRFCYTFSTTLTVVHRRSHQFFQVTHAPLVRDSPHTLRPDPHSRPRQHEFVTWN